MKMFLLLLFLVTGCKSPNVEKLNPLESYLNPQTKDDSLIREEYINLVNSHRQNLGTRALIYSDYIEDVAQEHSENMAEGKVPFGHTGSSVRCQKIITELGPANLCGEIVAQGQDNAKEVFASWIGSLAHKSKIENSRYTHTGLGIARNSRGVIYWTQIFLEVF
jgi:uncharacterized protein YkwD